MLLVHAFSISLMCILLLGVSVTPAFGALPFTQLERTLLDDTLGTDSTKASVQVKLADLHYVNNDFRKASQHYGAAFALWPSEHIKLKWARADMLQPPSDKALQLLKEIILEDTSSISDRAYYYLGNYYLYRKNFSRALDCYNEIKSPDNLVFAAPLLSAKYICALNMAFTGKAHKYLEKFKSLYGAHLESHELHRVHNRKYQFGEENFDAVFEGQPASESEKEESSENTNQRVMYTVQVGSFGSQENAKSLQKKMKEYFSTVTIVTADIKGNKYYRVRIGRFPTRSASESFAQKHLKPRNITYKVIQE